MELLQTRITALTNMTYETKSHIFALLVPEKYQSIAHYSVGKMIVLTDKDFIFRITTVLRLEVGSQLILFDRMHHILCKIIEIHKKEIHCLIKERSENGHYLPEVTCIVPLLKREALETVVDSLTQLGATTIQLITTQKTHRSKLDQKEFDRLQRIIIAAAEQSKNYRFPILKKAEPLMAIGYNGAEETTIFLDPDGNACFDTITKIIALKLKKITLMSGPEGDLTAQEKAFLHEKNVIFMALTPTILRAEQAAALSLGIIRSAFNTRP